VTSPIAGGRGGWLAAVSYWDVERHEVEIVVDDGLVQNIHVRVERARSSR